ncbi:MAG: beta strand repeat-containing protein [Rhodoluna sp.]
MSRILSRNGRASRVTAVLLSVAFGITGSLVFQTPAEAATATINNVGFQAPVFDSYDHRTGGGAWNDGSTTYVKGELLGTNYACGDFATFLAEVQLNATPTKQPGPYKAQIVVDFTTDTTGQSGVSLTPDISTSHLKVNSGVIPAYGSWFRGGSGTGGSDGGFSPSTLTPAASVATSPAPTAVQNGTVFTSGSTNRLTYTVQGLVAGTRTIVRMDAKIGCKAGSSPTGNLQASLMSIIVTSPSPNETISGGNQTVNFRGVSNLTGLTAPLLSVTKYISTDGSCNTVLTAYTVASPTYPYAAKYCYSVTNNASASATNVTLKDNNATPTDPSDDFFVTLTDGSTSNTTWPTLLGGGATLTGTATVSYGSAGVYTNIATAAATGAVSVTASAKLTLGAAPAMSIVKTQTSANPTAAGNVVTYSIVVTNTGAVTLPSVDVTDANATITSCTPTGTAVTNGFAFLNVAVNAVITCSASHTTTSTDISNGKINNIAIATATKPAGGTFAVQSSVVTTPSLPELTVTKAKTSTSPRMVGDVVTYSVTIQNTGNISLAGVTISDDTADILGCTPARPATLAVGASMVCQVAHTVDSTDFGRLYVENTAQAISTTLYPAGSPLAGQAVTGTSNTVHTDLLITPVISIVKTEASVVTVGSTTTINYSLAITNSGAADFVTFDVTDNNATPGTCDSGLLSTGAHVWHLSALAIGQTITCLASHVVQPADVTAGTYTNTATAVGTTNTGATASASSNSVSTITAFPELTLVKTQTSGAANAAGDVITYSIVATNTGNVALANVVVTDPNGTGLSCSPSASVTTLAVGAAITCSATHQVSPSDVTAGSYLNTAYATSTTIEPSTGLSIAEESPVTTIITPAATPTASSHPSLNVVKVVTGATPSKVGDVISYTITVTNTGDIALASVKLADANATLGACSVTLPGALAVAASFTCAATHVVTDADFKAGRVDNVAVASSSTGSLSVSSNLATVPLTPAPSLKIVKSLDGSAPETLGQAIVYKIVVTNTGNVTLTEVKVADTNAVLGACSPIAPASLAPNASMTCRATHIITVQDMLAGKVDNIATVTASSVSGSTSGSSNGALDGTSEIVTVPLTPGPKIAISKKQVGTLPSAIGGFIYYSIVVTNIGNIPLHAVTITDENAVITSCSVVNPVAILEVGESYSCSAKHQLTDADVLAGKVINIAGVVSKENATASSSSGSSSGGSSNSAPGSVNVSSNQVLTVIRVQSARYRGAVVSRPNGGTVTLGAAVLKNPKLTTLAFTGDLDNVETDQSLFIGMLVVIAGALGFRRRLQKK